MEKALITGCAGFIGSNLAKRLDNQFELYGIDNFHTGTKKNLIEINIKLNRLVSFNKPSFDYIFHLGMPSSSPMYLENPRMVNNAIMASIEAFERARHDNAKVIYASTSSMYNGNTPPFREDMKIEVKDYYTEARYFIERLAKLYNELHGVKSVGLRLFSCYGPKDINKGIYANVVTQFAKDMIIGVKPPLLYGDGNQARDFVHVNDVVDAFVLGMEYPETDVFNIGTGKSFSFNDAVNTINLALGTDIKPEYVNKQIHNYIFDTKADTNKSRKLLGFKAKVPFRKGLKEHALNLKNILNKKEPLSF